MSDRNLKSSERDWLDLAAAAARETDPEELGQIIEELCGALDKRNQQNQSHSGTPDRKSA